MKLNNEETSKAYKKLRKASYHLANNTENVQKLTTSQRITLFYSIQANLKDDLLEYDKHTKTAKTKKNLKILDKYITAKKTPENLSILFATQGGN